jgi:hypothetical protein
MLNEKNEIIELQLPKDSKVLSCGGQDIFNVVIWYKFTMGSKELMEPRFFYVAETGKQMNANVLQFIGTVQFTTGDLLMPYYVVHVFEVESI